MKEESLGNFILERLKNSALLLTQRIMNVEMAGDCRRACFVAVLPLFTGCPCVFADSVFLLCSFLPLCLMKSTDNFVTQTKPSNCCIFKVLNSTSFRYTQFFQVGN